jgi:hypothetical protein
MNALLNSIPRDANYDSELWTTVDKDRTNVRVKAVSKILQGFSLYLVLMGKNFIFENRTETRYRDLLIVCNVQASSGPVDMEGLYYHVSGAAGRMLMMGEAGAGPAQLAGSEHSPKTLEDCENGMDLSMSRKGVVRSNTNPKCKNKVRLFTRACVCVRARIFDDPSFLAGA